MTILEALRADVGQPVSDDRISLVCINRSLVEDADYSGLTQSFELAVADLCVMICNNPNVSEGSLSVSYPDAVLKNLKQRAEGIYAKYKVPSPFNRQNGVRGISPW